MGARLELQRTGSDPSGGAAARKAWVVSRHAGAVAELMARGVPFDVAWDVAVPLVTHWARETGWGRSEWNYAIGNIRAGRTWQGDVHYLKGGDDAEPRPYRAYGSLAEGLRDTFDLLTNTRYRGALAALTASVRAGEKNDVTYGGDTFAVVGDPVGWYAALMRAGWHPYSDASLNDFRGVLKTTSAWIGRPDATNGLLWGLGVGAALLALLELMNRRLGASRVE